MLSPMHLGRSHHSAAQIAVSLCGGFAASFLTFAVTTFTQNYDLKGQLMAGDPSVNRQLPTTLNAMQGAMDGSSPMIQAMTTYGWWVMVIIGGFIAAFIILKMMRRFV